MSSVKTLINTSIKKQYLLHQMISASDLAATFEALDEKNQKTVILKYFVNTTAEFKDGIQKAVRYQAQFKDSPRIVPVIEYGNTTEGNFWVVLEHQGVNQSLKHWMNDAKNQSMIKASHVLYHLAEAIKVVHQNGQPHANLKPSNLFMGAQIPSLKVSDLGGNGLYGVHKKDKQRIVINDPAFFSPEQANGKETQLSTDYFNLGVIGYHLLLGASPFGGNTPDKILTSIIIGSPQIDATQVKDQSKPNELKDLVNLLNLCLSKNPAQRPNLHQISERLGELTQKLPLLQTGTGSFTAVQGGLGSGSFSRNTMSYQIRDIENAVQAKESKPTTGAWASISNGSSTNNLNTASGSWATTSNGLSSNNTWASTSNGLSSHSSGSWNSLNQSNTPAPTTTSTPSWSNAKPQFKSGAWNNTKFTTGSWSIPNLTPTGLEQTPESSQSAGFEQEKQAIQLLQPPVKQETADFQLHSTQLNELPSAQQQALNMLNMPATQSQIQSQPVIAPKSVIQQTSVGGPAVDILKEDSAYQQAVAGVKAVKPLIHQTSVGGPAANPFAHLSMDQIADDNWGSLVDDAITNQQPMIPHRSSMQSSHALIPPPEKKVDETLDSLVDSIEDTPMLGEGSLDQSLNSMAQNFMEQFDDSLVEQAKFAEDWNDDQTPTDDLADETSVQKVIKFENSSGIDLDHLIEDALEAVEANHMATSEHSVSIDESKLLMEEYQGSKEKIRGENLEYQPSNIPSLIDEAKLNNLDLPLLIGEQEASPNLNVESSYERASAKSNYQRLLNDNLSPVYEDNRITNPLPLSNPVPREITQVFETASDMPINPLLQELQKQAEAQLFKAQPQIAPILQDKENQPDFYVNFLMNLPLQMKGHLLTFSHFQLVTEDASIDTGYFPSHTNEPSMVANYLGSQIGFDFVKDEKVNETLQINHPIHNIPEEPFYQNKLFLIVLSVILIGAGLFFGLNQNEEASNFSFNPNNQFQPNQSTLPKSNLNQQGNVKEITEDDLVIEEINTSENTNRKEASKSKNQSPLKDSENLPDSQVKKDQKDQKDQKTEKAPESTNHPSNPKIKTQVPPKSNPKLLPKNANPTNQSKPNKTTPPPQIEKKSVPVKQEPPKKPVKKESFDDDL